MKQTLVKLFWCKSVDDHEDIRTEMEHVINSWAQEQGVVIKSISISYVDSPVTLARLMAAVVYKH